MAVYLVLLGIIFGGGGLWGVFVAPFGGSGWNSLVWFIPSFGPLYVLYHLGFQPPVAGSTSSNGEAGDTRSA